jgi:hypothetical protein
MLFRLGTAPSFAISLDPSIVTQNDAKTVQASFFVRHRDQLPVAASRGNFDSIKQSGLVISGASRGRHQKQ